MLSARNNTPETRVLPGFCAPNIQYPGFQHPGIRYPVSGFSGTVQPVSGIRLHVGFRYPVSAFFKCRHPGTRHPVSGCVLFIIIYVWVYLMFSSFRCRGFVVLRGCLFPRVGVSVMRNFVNCEFPAPHSTRSHTVRRTEA